MDSEIRFTLRVTGQSIISLCKIVGEKLNLKAGDPQWLDNPIICAIRENAYPVDDTDYDSPVEYSIAIDSLDILYQYLYAFQGQEMVLYFDTDHKQTVYVQGSIKNKIAARHYGNKSTLWSSVKIDRSKDDAELSKRIEKAIGVLKGKI